jgi:hypothetical protein
MHTKITSKVGPVVGRRLRCHLGRCGVARHDRGFPSVDCRSCFRQLGAAQGVPFKGLPVLGDRLYGQRPRLLPRGTSVHCCFG